MQQQLMINNMSDTKVLLLGWEFMPARQEELDQSNGCYTMAKALGDRVDLSMILPVADPEVILQNVTLTGLNNVDLPAIEPAGPKKDVQPFAEGPHIRQQIPLYGAPDQPASQRPLAWAEQAGQAASAGILQGGHGDKNMKEAVENLNIFGQEGLHQAGLDVQIIQYARWATRLAAHREFDVIYAYDWRTFLAGSELKLVSEKPLVLQVHSLSQDRDNSDSQGWMYQIELQALQKADCIIAATDHLAGILAQNYHVSPDLINSLEGKKASAAPAEAVSSEELAPKGLNETGAVVGIKPAKNELAAKPAGQERKRAKAADKIRDILLQVAA
jgi:glycogen synthase